MKKQIKHNPVLISDTKQRIIDKSTTHLYCLVGKNLVITSDINTAIAKIIYKEDNSQKYFILCGTQSINRRKPLDPWVDEQGIDKLTQTNFFEWLEVSKENFEEYHSFLSTRNKSHLLSLERKLSI